MHRILIISLSPEGVDSEALIMSREACRSAAQSIQAHEGCKCGRHLTMFINPDGPMEAVIWDKGHCAHESATCSQDAPCE